MTLPLLSGNAALKAADVNPILALIEQRLAAIELVCNGLDRRLMVLELRHPAHVPAAALGPWSTAP